MLVYKSGSDTDHVKVVKVVIPQVILLSNSLKIGDKSGK